MKEMKLKLKPFDLEAAKAGKPVCTRDGRKARIICFDAKNKDEKNIIALVSSKDCPGFENLIAYPNNGNYYRGYENNGDLMMLLEKKEGWVNIYKSDNGTYYTGAIFYEKNDALVNTTEIEITTGISRDCIDTVKISWEEQLWHGWQQISMIKNTSFKISQKEITIYGKTLYMNRLMVKEEDQFFIILVIFICLKELSRNLQAKI